MKRIFTLIKTKITGNYLYLNSFYLIVTNAIASGSGFLFWILIARVYSTEQIGIATSLFSLVNLIATLSLLGFNTGLMRFLPLRDNNNEKINSSILIISSVSLILTLFFILSLKIYAKPLLFIQTNPVYLILFIVYTLLTALNLLGEAIFIAYRTANHVLFKTIIQSVFKLFLPFLFISLGGFGIFNSLSLSVVIAFIYSAIAINKLYGVRYKINLDLASVRSMAYVSLGTYISGLASNLPSFALPLLITGIVGPTVTAYYYIAGTTANVLFMIPSVITRNLLVEGSYGEEELKSLIRRTSHLMAMILIPSIVLMIFFGNYILLVFGKNYSIEGIVLLKYFALSVILVGINSIFGTLLTIFKKVKLLIIVNVIGAVSLLIFSYWLLKLGIVGIGYATIVSQFLMFLLYCFYLFRIKKLYLVRYLF